VLTHPNNPTTTVHDREHLTALARLIVENDLVLVCDQAFEDHLFDGIEFVSPAALPGMWERTLSVHSFSKGYGLSGLRVGYIVGHEHLLEPLLQAAVLVLGAPNTLAQVGALAALQDEMILPAYRDEFDERRRHLAARLQDVPGVRISPAESGILSWVDVSELGSAADVARHLREYARVLVNEGDAYGPGGEGHLRIVHGAMADRERFTAAVDRIRDALLSYTR
jgi:aspartate/methionine/tyrosine aminotransferase